MRILEFIKQNCKNVEFKPLYELTIWDKKFKGIPKEWQEKTIKFNHILSADLKNLLCDDGDIFLLSTGNFSGYTNSEICKNFNQAEIIALPSGGFANIKYFNGKFIDSGNLLAISKDTSKVNLKFIFYYLQSNLKIIEKMFRGAGIKHPEMSSILSIKIPVPSLEVQNKIVEVLDSFTSLEHSLERSLEREKLAREKQYKYYLKHLITNARNSRIFKLGEVCEILAGGDVPKNAFSKNKTDDFQVPIFSNGIGDNALYGFTNQVRISKRSVTVSARGTIGFCALRKEPYYPIIRLLCVIPKNEKELIADYLCYALQVANFKGTSSAISQLTAPMARNIEISLPPLDEQERIVRILDSLNELANGLSAGIPKEIELRQKQYEYWRDRLLEFPSKDSK